MRPVHKALVLQACALYDRHGQNGRCGIPDIAPFLTTVENRCFILQRCTPSTTRSTNLESVCTHHEVDSGNLQGIHHKLHCSATVSQQFPVLPRARDVNFHPGRGWRLSVRNEGVQGCRRWPGTSLRYIGGTTTSCFLGLWCFADSILLGTR